MTATVPVNGETLRHRLLELGLSDRGFGARSGLGDATVRGILLRNEINGSISIADVRRAVNEAGMTFNDLFDMPAWDHPDETPTDDCSVLAQVLNGERRMHPEDRLALALGWHIDRLRTAAEELDARLGLLGLRIHTNSMGMCIRAADTRGEGASQQLSAYRDADDGIGQGTARVLYAAYRGTLSPTDTSTDRTLQLGALANRRAITFGSGVGKRVRLTDDVAYAFDVAD